jgi:hypothetical protein
MNHASGKSTRSLFDPAFLVAIAILASAAFGVGPRMLKEAGPKLPVPLKAPLGEMDKTAVGPYRFVGQIPMSSSVQEVLGTDEFIDFKFVDTRIEKESNPLRHVRLSVPYYTGGHDLVPHTPDQCMIGAGYAPKIAEDLELDIPALGRKVPVRVLTFEKSEILKKAKPTVAYLFHCNGEFVCTRGQVRRRMNALTQKHAYFAKIEVSFGSPQATPHFAPREESIAATADFLNHVLPILLADHLPDWEAVVREGERVQAAAR